MWLREVASDMVNFRLLQSSPPYTKLELPEVFLSVHSQKGSGFHALKAAFGLAFFRIKTRWPLLIPLTDCPNTADPKWVFRISLG